MNTVEKGNKFEALAHNIITKAITDRKLGIDPACARVHRKKGYYSEKRREDIVFDISIEIWPPDANRASITYFVECKDYSHRIPVDDVTLFNSYIQEVSGVNAKGVFIARGGFQSGAYTTAESYGMMLISVEHENKYDILLYSKSRGLILDKEKHNERNQDITDAFLLNLSSLFANYLIERSLKKLSKLDISRIAEQELLSYKSDFFDGIHSLDFPRLAKYMEENYQVGVCESNASMINGVWGIFDVNNSTIIINSSLSAERKTFVLAHEFGHLILHRNTILSQSEYERLSDSQYDFKSNKYILKNPKNWIEWQANYFAASLLMHRKQIEEVQYFHQMRKHGRYSTLYLDDQPINIKVFNDTIKKMAYLLGVSKTSLMYRLNEFSMIENRSRLKSLKLIIDDYIDGYFI